MGQVIRRFDDPILEIFRRLRQTDQAVNRLQQRTITLPLDSNSSFTIQDTDGNVWIDPSDHAIHYNVGGHEYKLVGTLVS